MAKKCTVGNLFEIAIAFEKNAEAFYLGLAKKFSNHPKVSSFWKSMMEDEIRHAKELERIREHLTQEQLKSPCDIGTTISGNELASFSLIFNLERVNNLAEACEMAHDIEASEMNAKVQSLAKQFISPEMRVDFMLLVLETHVSRLREFSESFGPEEKVSICADMPES